MEPHTTEKSAFPLTGMDSIRAKAKRQTISKLKKHEIEQAISDVAAPLGDIRNLKERERHSIEKEAEIKAEPIWMVRVWHRFQEALGNR